MGRLIDAEELKEIIGCGNAVKYGNADREQQDVSYSTMMMYEINDAIDTAPTACEWHCVADELPHDDTTVLIAHRAGVSTGWFNGRYWEQGAGTGHRMLKTVTHWMPLPKPPERSPK